ncbi:MULTISPECIES: succinate dehydrogenase, cytochrome b556 subunit [unclassified Brevundimonas]|uniref:succinate dehydrogenase, cytochrome b556 subunit n=1 Tax=unclassified Brevundimonas TaxID=2622653 RepID=UPI002004BB48|nr:MULTISPECIES: succinate dehydrogenase, cytochrome b556 subunit [unclassified Brevundimonas]MCK6105665.1 succinate dehydrogenase, cytochrome b556 subunit [Brevundimonas sp. EYE_349]
MTKPSPKPGGAANDRTGRFVTQPNGHVTPLSPHMGVWRWHVTMAASILFRATIIAATVGVLFVVAWLGAMAFGPERYADFLILAGSPLGLFVGFGLTVVLFSFVLNGARHTYNDTGNGLTLGSANLLSNIAVWAPVPLAVLFWVVLFVAGRVSL